MAWQSPAERSFQPPLADLKPISIAAFLSGGAFAWLQRDVRWLLVTIGACGLILVGSWLQWLVYDRWVRLKS